MSDNRISALEQDVNNLTDTLKYLASVINTVEERLECMEEHLMDRDGFVPPEPDEDEVDSF